MFRMQHSGAGFHQIGSNSLVRKARREDAALENWRLERGGTRRDAARRGCAYRAVISTLIVILHV